MLQSSISAELVARTDNRYIDHDRLLPAQGIASFFETGSVAGIQPAHARRLGMLLNLLNTAQAPADMDLSGLRLHALKGFRPTRWSVYVSGNWRLTFEFANGNAYVVDYEDYH